MDGKIILPGFDISEYGGYTGKDKNVLRVGNMLKERDLMMGYSSGESETLAGPRQRYQFGASLFATSTSLLPN